MSSCNELNISSGGTNHQMSTSFEGMYNNCNSLISINKMKLWKHPRTYRGNGSGASPVTGCTNLQSVSEFNVDFTQDYPIAAPIYTNNDFWISAGWIWFKNLSNLVDINFTGTVYSSDTFNDYRILRGCKTQNFTAETWQSFVDIFPDNSSSGITKRVCVGINIAHIPETYANLLTSKGYTLYAANS